MSHYPALLIVVTKHLARWFEINESKATLLKEMNLDKNTYSDHEGRFGGTRTQSGKIGSPDVENTAEQGQLKTFSNAVAEKNTKLWKTDYEHLSIVVPEHLKNIFGGKIQKKCKAKSVKFVYGNHHEADENIALNLYKESLKIHPK